MPQYTFYVDALLLRLGANLLFEYLLLWATAEVTRTGTRPAKLLAGALLGTIHYALYLLASFGLIPYYGLLRLLPTVVIVSLFMVLAAFYPLSVGTLPKILGWFYVIGFIAAGAGMAGAFLLGSPANPAYTLGMLIAAGCILLIAELGWGIVHQRIIHNVYHLPVEIACGGKQVAVQALVDTGNNLRDPLSLQPVMIVEQKAIQALLPPRITAAVQALDQGQLASLDGIVDPEWSTRFRIIPFSSIGKEHGILIGFRPDAVHIRDGQQGPAVQPVIAIHPRALDPEGKYAALIPPTLLQQAIDDPAILPTAKGGQRHAATHHHEV
ncbi:MAG TPA: sigma-E processing peptidase SpoIIGA [Firmicutes bacterium]|nr:MAG: hypothetical protein AA931_02360 [Peptococcaceae bacterium 1109]HHT72645.1 sigma-E processing peptidase SpoIIGA [Bacillota bacterium]